VFSCWTNPRAEAQAGSRSTSERGNNHSPRSSKSTSLSRNCNLHFLGRDDLRGEDQHKGSICWATHSCGNRPSRCMSRARLLAISAINSSNTLSGELVTGRRRISIHTEYVS
jgi:hypothetical protein